MNARRPSWWELLDLDWEAEQILIDTGWARELRWIDATREGGDHGQGHPDVQPEAGGQAPTGPDEG